MGRPEAALEPLERALAMRVKAQSSPMDVATTKLLLGRALWSKSGERPRAVTLVTEARHAFATKPEREKDRAEAAQWLAAHAGSARAGSARAP